MANTVKERLRYWPMPFDFYDDPRIIRATMEFGEITNSIVGKLINQIFNNSYFIKWDEDFIVVFAQRHFIRTSVEQIIEVTDYLLEKDYFSKEMFERYEILTSETIQKQWQEMIIASRRKAQIKLEYNLINAEEIVINVEEKGINAEEIDQKKRNKRSKEIEQSTISSNKVEFVEKMFVDYTKYKLPNREYKILPIVNLFNEIPDPLTEVHLKRAIEFEFAKFTKEDSIKVDFLIENIRLRLAAIREDVLAVDKKKELSEAEKNRREEKIQNDRENKEFVKEKLKEYNQFLGSNSNKFTKYEKEEFRRLASEGKIIQAGSIIERKMEGGYLPPPKAIS